MFPSGKWNDLEVGDNDSCTAFNAKLCGFKFN